MKGFEIILVLAAGVVILISTTKGAQGNSVPASPGGIPTEADYVNSLGISGPGMGSGAYYTGTPDSVPPL